MKKMITTQAQFADMIGFVTSEVANFND